jgi:hypothetical protein
MNVRIFNKPVYENLSLLIFSAGMIMAIGMKGSGQGIAGIATNNTLNPF